MLLKCSFNFVLIWIKRREGILRFICAVNPSDQHFEVHIDQKSDFIKYQFKTALVIWHKAHVGYQDLMSLQHFSVDKEVYWESLKMDEYKNL